MTPEEVRQIGTKKYFEDKGIYRNPYQIGTPEYNEFERGWMQSLKRDNGKLIDIANNKDWRSSRNIY